MSKVKEYKEFRPRMNANASEFSPAKKAQSTQKGGNATKRKILPSPLPSVITEKSTDETKTEQMEQVPVKTTTQRNRKRQGKLPQPAGKEQDKKESETKMSS